MQGVPQNVSLPFGSYVLVHPGATVPARMWSPARNAELVEQLCSRGINVVVTGASDETALTSYVAGNRALDLGGKTSFMEFAAITRQASAVVCGNTATAHVASAVGTPVVSIFPPTIPAVRFRPWMVTHALLGDQSIECAGCRARACPIPGQPCLDVVKVDDVLRALNIIAALPAEVA
jgi:ADP-heptose:LPS heptosyltransferase